MMWATLGHPVPMDNDIQVPIHGLVLTRNRLNNRYRAIEISELRRDPVENRIDRRLQNEMRFHIIAAERSESQLSEYWHGLSSLYPDVVSKDLEPLLIPCRDLVLYSYLPFKSDRFFELLENEN
jgi:hypothetical protein